MLFLLSGRAASRGSIVYSPRASACHAFRTPPTTQFRIWPSIRMSHAVRDNLLNSSSPVEEETIRGYREQDYYPVKMGEVFQERYKVIGKLGFGSASTVWLCHDLHQREPQVYVALKMYINNSKEHRELPIYAHINSLQSDHLGSDYVRRLLDSFKVSGPHGQHTCLVHEALGMNLEELRDLVDEEFAPDLVRQLLRGILRALHFLHDEAHVIHTDIQTRNILFGVHDNSAFMRFESDERERPMPRKELPSRSIYVSRPMPFTKGAPKLCDFSEARFAKPQSTDVVMPDIYRAPEVLLGMPWSYYIDLWGFVMTLWDLFQPKRLFSPKGEDGRYSEEHHLAEMVALMGPPPLDFLRRSDRSQIYWDLEGNWKGKVPIPNISLETAEQRLQGEEKMLYLSFIRKVLQWRPEDRCSLEDLYMDEWLLADLIESGEVVREEYLSFVFFSHHLARLTCFARFPPEIWPAY